MKSKIHFITIGYVEWRKGQDLLVDAIEMLPDNARVNSEFLFIGQNSSLLAQKISDRISNIPCVHMQGTVPREEIHDLLGWADVMICPSREDPMPTVCAEAMMHEVPCLVSDSTGTASYIRNEYDGLVYANEDAKDLSDKINWCINNQSKLKEMGSRALKIYEHFFSTDAFETNLLKYVKEMI